MTFEKLIGNEKVKQNLINVLEKGNISHSYMFIGTKGIGKKEFARIFAKGILCLNENRPCKNCKSCLEFDNNNNPEYYEIGLEEENSIKIDQIRQMQKSTQELPIVSNKKVYVIDRWRVYDKRCSKLLAKDTRRATRVCNNYTNCVK